MYHHFSRKAELARAAIERSAEELQAAAETTLSGPGTAVERLSAYLGRARDVLRGCPIGRLAADPEVVSSPELRAPVAETFAWLEGRLAEVVGEGQAAGELSPDLEPPELAAALVAVLQGGYVLARAAGTRAPFDRAIRGALGLMTAAGSG